MNAPSTIEDARDHTQHLTREDEIRAAVRKACGEEWDIAMRHMYSACAHAHDHLVYVAADAWQQPEIIAAGVRRMLTKRGLIAG